MAEVDYEDIEVHERLRAARAAIAQQKAEIERLRHNLHTTQTHLHQTLIALNDLTAIPTDPQHQHHARTTLANILNQRHITITAIRPHTPNTYGT